jgi:hypothetical protein
MDCQQIAFGVKAVESASGRTGGGDGSECVATGAKEWFWEVNELFGRKIPNSIGTLEIWLHLLLMTIVALRSALPRSFLATVSGAPGGQDRQN